LFEISLPKYAAVVHIEPERTDVGRRNWRT